MLFVCHSYVNRMYSYAIRMLFVCHSDEFVNHLCALACRSDATRMYSYVICIWFYHEPSIISHVQFNIVLLLYKRYY